MYHHIEAWTKWLPFFIKMAAILLMTCPNAFLSNEIIVFWFIFCGNSLLRVNDTTGKSSLFQVMTWWEAIIWNTLRLRQNGCHFADDIFKCISLNENVWIPIKISLKFLPRGPINNIPALVQIMAWRRPGDKPLSGPKMVRLLTHICVTRPQWVNPYQINLVQHSQYHGCWCPGSLRHQDISTRDIEPCRIY